MVKKCSVTDILRKLKVKKIPLVDIVLFIGIGIYSGNYIYKESEDSLKMYIEHKPFILAYTLALLLVYLMVNYLLQNNTMIGYYLKINPYPIQTVCKI